MKEKYNCEAYFAVLAPKSGKKSCYIFNLQDLLEFPWNLDRERVKALNFSSKYEQQIEIYERSENILIHNVEDLEQKIGNAASLRAEMVMINLNEYQTIFDHNITHERCKQVLVQIEAPLKPILQKFKDSLNDPSLYLHSYGVTLTTTYHDALNPKYATNLSTALGEMHKYRDGILVRDKEIPAVEDVFILTPSKGQEELRYFQERYHIRYRMGAIEMVPGQPNTRAIEKVIDGFIKKDSVN